MLAKYQDALDMRLVLFYTYTECVEDKSAHYLLTFLLFLGHGINQIYC